MKTSFFFLSFLAVCCFVACTPSEEEMHPKRRSPRTDNLQRYMHKAQETRALAQARSKPVVSGPLVTAEVFKDMLPKTADRRISSQILAQKLAMESSVKDAAARRAGEKVSAILSKYQTDAVAAARTAKSPQELSTRLADLNARYSKQLSNLAQDEESQSWSRPDADQSRFSKQRLKDSARDLHDSISRDYGPVCAQKADPVLQKAADDYWLALSSVQTAEDIQTELQRVGDEADSAFATVVENYADPLAAFSEADSAALRARMIAAHQDTEVQFEKLYGKDAVLQTRDIFQRYMNEAVSLARKPARLSQKQEALDRLGDTYRKDMTALQVRLNGDLDRKAAAARGIPPVLAGK